MIPEGRSILLVDDESDIVNSVKRWLKADGFNVHGFTNSLQGYELVKKIKSIRPEIKVVLMTALETDLPELSKILPSIKIDGFMLKPGRIESLVKTIKSIFLTSSVG